MNAKILLAGLVAASCISCSAAKVQQYKDWRAARLADPNYRRAVGMAAAGMIQRNADIAAEANRRASVPADYSPTIVNYGAYDDTVRLRPDYMGGFRGYADNGDYYRLKRALTDDGYNVEIEGTNGGYSEIRLRDHGAGLRGYDDQGKYYRARKDALDRLVIERD